MFIRGISTLNECCITAVNSQKVSLLIQDYMPNMFMGKKKKASVALAAEPSVAIGLPLSQNSATVTRKGEPK